MSKITLDLEELKKEKIEHERAIERIDSIIDYYLKNNSNEYNNTITKNRSRMKTALKISEQHLKEGNTIHTINEFYALITSKGIKLSRSAMSVALQSPESNIKYDKLRRIWTLKQEQE